MRKTLLAAGAVLAAIAVIVVVIVIRGGSATPPRLPEDAMPGRLLVGFQDDPTLRWAEDRMVMLARARRAGATVIRTTVDWAQVAPRRPARPADAFDPAYRLDDVDELTRNAQRLGIELLISIWGTPRWANGGKTPNYAPDDPHDLEDFAHALADRYSGRHPGYPSVRLFSVWNEPNLEQFLAPQFDGQGRSISPAIYARLVRAIYQGVKDANSDALVAIGETSAHGRDAPSRDRIQDSHSPVRFARLLAAAKPRVEFDAWAQHPYPPPGLSPRAPVRWPRVGLSNLNRFGHALDAWFQRPDIPLWITEYGLETRPADPHGITPALQARYGPEALRIASALPRVRMFVWFVFHDRSETPWQSGLIAADGQPKPALAPFSRAARRLSVRQPLVADDAGRVYVPALELAYRAPVGSSIQIQGVRAYSFSVHLRRDGWLDVPLTATDGSVIAFRAADGHGNAIWRFVRRRGS
jgi:cellulase (glycosyl hydrolase family 5)